MSLNNWFLVAMGLFYLAPAIIYKEYFLALAFILYALVFGFTEFCASYYTGKTISEQMWALISEHQWKGIIICVSMVLAMLCLTLHLMGVGRK
jgi:hypothetical protein